MDQLWAAVIGAVVGGVVGGLIGGLFTWWGAQSQIQQARSQARQDKTWGIANVVTTVQSEILSASTPNTLKSADDVFRLQAEWDKTDMQVHIGFVPKFL